MISINEIKNKQLADILFYLIKKCPEIDYIDMDMFPKEEVGSKVWINIAFTHKNENYFIAAQSVQIAKRRLLEVLGKLGVE